MRPDVTRPAAPFSSWNARTIPMTVQQAQEGRIRAQRAQERQPLLHAQLGQLGRAVHALLHGRSPIGRTFPGPAP